jgi:hypothetical protein
MTGIGHQLSGNTIEVVGLKDYRTAPPPATPFIDNRMQVIYIWGNWDSYILVLSKFMKNTGFP